MRPHRGEVGCAGTHRGGVVMAQHVAGDLYHDLDGQLNEIKRQLRQNSGYPFDPMALKRHLQKAVEGKFVSGVTPAFVHDKTKDGWTLIENTVRRITSVRDTELVSFLKNGEVFINGEEMLRRARVEFDANCGQEDAEYLLKHEAKIPEEFSLYYPVFPGTVWQDSGHSLVPYLLWDGERWILSFGWLWGVWSSRARLVRPLK